MTTLEDLYYGNIHPYERNIKKTGRESALLRLVVKNENDLLATLTEQQKDIFQKCKDAESEMHCAFEPRSFMLRIPLSSVPAWWMRSACSARRKLPTYMRRSSTPEMAVKC